MQVSSLYGFMDSLASAIAVASPKHASQAMLHNSCHVPRERESKTKNRGRKTKELRQKDLTTEAKELKAKALESKPNKST
jgi:hypothetical protein